MAQYRKCPYCSANLDPGEMCDCEEAMKEKSPVGGQSEQAKSCNNSTEMITRKAVNVK
ncbi:MAG: hypothetical protein RR956_05920 [Christensenella sp.]